MKQATILIVEDDVDIHELLEFSLSSEGYQLLSAFSVKEAWQKIENNEISLVLLDWMLPDNSGIDLLRRIRKYHTLLPVIMITAKTEEENKILGLDVGADDYITKPFSIRELKSRIQAVLRRTLPEEQSIQIGRLLLDPISQRVMVGESELDISATEFRLLHYFMGHTDRVFSRSQLLDQVWGMNSYVEERTVDVHIRRVRKKLETHGLSSLLQTVHGSGYRFSRQL
ncbi:MAG: response regulator [Methylococcales bacterium]|jgi:two-component system, OmpR family, phosphate regulon response regulator PhoB|nr:response regulator [Methylococcales bacterium]MBT7410044.1 response regulator [Methylococcales bacterium]